MARPSRPANPERTNYIQVRLVGSLKNDVAKAAKKAGVSINTWMVLAIKAALRADKGLPEPPPAVVPLRTEAEELLAYMSGEPLLTPCGIRGDCRGTTDEPFMLEGMGFCRECDIRLL